MFVSPAFAQAAGGGGPESFLTGIMPIVLIFAVFYFLLIRPQQKRVKEHKRKVEAVRRGDRVVTGGGIIGTITKVTSDTELQIEIAEGVKVKVARQTLSDVLSKTEPAEPSKESEGGSAAKKSVKGFLSRHIAKDG